MRRVDSNDLPCETDPSMQRDLDALIRARIEAFVEELTDLVRQAALDAVTEALGGARAERRAPRPTPPSRPSPSTSRRPRARAADVERQKELVLEAAQNLGPRFAKKDVVAATGLTDDATRVLALLVKEGKLEKRGERRLTTYSLK